jgi:chromosome segregation ATPase
LSERLKEREQEFVEMTARLKGYEQERSELKARLERILSRLDGLDLG